MEQYLVTYSGVGLTRKSLVKKSFQLLQAILDNPLISTEEAVKLTRTPYGYKGTDFMTDEELVIHHRTLYDNYQSLKGNK